MIKRFLLTLGMGYSVVCTLATAGLTDFKTIEQANRAYEAKEYEKSAALLNTLEKESPQKQYDIGNAYYKDKKYDEALNAYEKSEGVDEQTRLHNMGNSYFQKKELDKAIEFYENALKFKDDEDTKFNLELAKKQKKKEEEQKKQDKEQKEKQKEDQKQEDQKKKDDKEKSDSKKKDEAPKEKKSEEKKDDKKGSSSKEEQQKAKEEKIQEQELKRLMKKMQKGKTPTMMYQMGEGQKGQQEGGINPW